MTEDEIIDKAEALPERFADRFDRKGALWSVKQMARRRRVRPADDRNWPHRSPKHKHAGYC